MYNSDLVIEARCTTERRIIPFTTHTFSGGEEHIRLEVPKDLGKIRHIHIQARLTSSKKIMRLLLTVDALRMYFGEIKIELGCHYFPYARQDRVCNPGESFSLKTMTTLINNLRLHTVYVTDPHSNAIAWHLHNCIILPQDAIFVCHYVPLLGKTDVIISPDKGATEKTKLVQKVLKIPEILQATKVRNPLTGEIVRTSLQGDVMGKDILIADDICDGGRTFIELAKILKRKGSKSITLYVTHGIFSKGFKVFEGLIDAIVTTDSFKSKEQYVADGWDVPLFVIRLYGEHNE